MASVHFSRPIENVSCSADLRADELLPHSVFEEEGEEVGGGGWLGLLLSFFLGLRMPKVSSPASRQPNSEMLRANNRLKNNSVVLTRGPEKLHAKCKPRSFLDARFGLPDVAAVCQRHQQINTIQVSL